MKYGFDTGKIRVTALLVVMAAVLLVGCRPKGVMSPSKMRDVLYDLHHADAVLQLAGYNYGHDDAVAQYYNEVLRKQGVTQAELDSSLVWYTAHPNRFQRIYPRLIARIQKEQELAKLQKEQEGLKRTETMTLPVLAADTLRLDSVLEVYRCGLRLPDPLKGRGVECPSDTIVGRYVLRIEDDKIEENAEK